jgi:hypothetical protein
MSAEWGGNQKLETGNWGLVSKMRDGRAACRHPDFGGRAVVPKRTNPDRFERRNAARGGRWVARAAPSRFRRTFRERIPAEVRNTGGARPPGTIFHKFFFSRNLRSNVSTTNLLHRISGLRLHQK